MAWHIPQSQSGDRWPRPNHGEVVARFTHVLGLAAVVALCLCGVLLAAPSAWALDAVKAAANMARKAAGAFEEGDHLRAAELYLQAYASDPKTPEYIYGAARAEQVGGKLDLAERHFQEYLAKPNATNRVENAKKYLAEVRVAKSELHVSAAAAAEKANDLPLAAQHYADCRAMVPSRWDCLFHEAMARRRRIDKEVTERDKAIALLTQYLEGAPADAPDRGQARVVLTALQAPSAPESSMIGQATPAAPPPAPEPPPVVVKVADPEPPKPEPFPSPKLVGWSVLGAGVVLGATGLGLLIKAAVDRSALEASWADGSTGLIEGQSHSDAQAAADKIANRRVAGGIIAGIGLAGAGVGTWLVWNAYPSARKTASWMVVPGVGAADVVVRF